MAPSAWGSWASGLEDWGVPGKPLRTGNPSLSLKELHAMENNYSTEPMHMNTCSTCLMLEGPAASQSRNVGNGTRPLSHVPESSFGLALCDPNRAINSCKRLRPALARTDLHPYSRRLPSCSLRVRDMVLSINRGTAAYNDPYYGYHIFWESRTLSKRLAVALQAPTNWCLRFL